MKLDFVCIGAQKAGTTKLHEILSSDKKNFNFPNPKEAHFFDIDERGFIIIMTTIKKLF